MFTRCNYLHQPWKACVSPAFWLLLTLFIGSFWKLFHEGHSYKLPLHLLSLSNQVALESIKKSLPFHIHNRNTIPTTTQRNDRLLFSAIKETPCTLQRLNGHYHVKFLGVGSASPSTILTNEDLEQQIDTSNDWITSRTGISRRHVLSHGETLSFLAAEAARTALKQSNLSAADVGMIILATSTPDDMFGDAAWIADKIGAHNAVGWDLTAACSGFLFALVTASQYLENGAYKNIVIIGADGLSQWVNWDDRNTCILFGDGAGAVVCQATQNQEENCLLSWALRSDGSKKQHLTLANSKKMRSLKTAEKHVLNSAHYNFVQMSGKEVFLFATREVPKIILKALEKANVSKDDVDWILLHQANIRIMSVVADQLKISKSKLLCNLQEYGNTSAASIPLCLDEAVRQGKIKNGDLIVIAGFGAGLSWGASVVRWNGLPLSHH